jgi:hypothetical protein
MAVISITRLRIRGWRFLPQFVVASLRCAKQAAAADGNLHAALFIDRHLAFWTSTSWTSEAAMKAFMLASPHGPIMRKLLNWCDEASLVHWTQERDALPDWSEAHRRLAAEGRPSKVNHPTPAHQALTFPSPRTVMQTRLK